MNRRHYCWLAFLILACSNVVASQSSFLGNQLNHHPSPYLAMHSDDPVHWQVWNKAALDKAKKLNRPILVSIGYFSCHWCHVMQRESYQDEELAEVLNRFFIPVKVDRELNPALDAHLIEFVELTRGQAGWPLNVILTPDGLPLLGMTYLPRDQFYLLLIQLKQRWQDEAALLRTAAGEAMHEWRSMRQTESRQKAAVNLPLKSLLAQADQIKDELSGGFGQQTKFPMVPQLTALLKIRRHPLSKDLDAFIRLTLDQMASQGLHDNLGGGFFRYVVDPGWQVPHYEKMLYDNAQLATLYFQAAEVYRSREYLAIARSTLDFMLREMQEDAAFISSFSAVDDEGREGYYYQWSDEQLDKALTDKQLHAVSSAWFGERAPESEYGRLPRWQADRRSIAGKFTLSADELDVILSQARDKLLSVRAKRDLPADSKVLAAWNGLALSALAAGAATNGEDPYRDQADNLADFLMTRLWDGSELLRFEQAEQLSVQASLEDYALVAQGLWDWGRQQPDAAADYLALSAKLVRSAWRRYFVNGRWRLDDTPLIPMLEGKLALPDGALPSVTAVISKISMEHPELRKDEAIQVLLKQHLDSVSAKLSDEMFWYASYTELLQ